MKIAYTGNGFLGKKLHEKFGYDDLGCDVTNQVSVRSAIREMSPDVIIHTAAMTSVDECEKDARKAFDVNVRGVSNLLGEFNKPNQILIYLSTDHVFSGENWIGGGYRENHQPSPKNTYGFTKWGGEVMLTSATCKVLTIRTSKMFDLGLLKPELDVLRAGVNLEFTTLIKRSFLHTDHFLSGLQWVIVNFDFVRENTNLLHLSGKSVYSFYDFWIIAARILDLNPELIVPRKIKLQGMSPRPFRAGLNVDLAKRLGVPLFDAVDGLKLLKG